MKQLIDVAGAAEYLATSERHVRRLQQEGVLPHFKVGGKVRFDVAELDAWLEAQKVSS